MQPIVAPLCKPFYSRSPLSAGLVMQLRALKLVGTLLDSRSPLSAGLVMQLKHASDKKMEFKVARPYQQV